ncbi:MAG: TIGR04282 family arsenosugar biosynthesis glycosyltransferase [Melioribacteraceae bacterium]|nr:TIGR04282 family arsenosugar biosynthesis glycosyltransferase [Melioribacteraceae bacterium]
MNYEIIISDGGSNDDTSKIAEKFNAKIVNSEAGRGIQLNKGIDAANGEILCFLHADTALPDNAFELLEEFFQDIENKICRFKLGFDVDHRVLNCYGYFSKFDTLFTRFGDTFIAARNDFVEEIGSFPNWKNFEDVKFLREASKRSKVFVLDQEVVSSARTFVKYGLVGQQLISINYFVKYLLGQRKFIKEGSYYKRKMKKVTASIILFVKYPVEGNVKTRLAKTIGNAKAAKIYSLLAENIITNIKKMTNTYNYLFYSNSSEKEKIKKWIKGNFFYAPQKGNGLGERMSNAFRLVFGHGAKKVLIIGTDIPGLSTEIIKEAVTKLDEYDAVIGPSPDGGYYLLGMKRFIPELFENITYSTDSVFEETIKKIKNENLTYSLLNTKEDIDTEDELKNWLNNSKDTQLKKEISEIYFQNYERNLV